jgi:hypothetical protein
MNRAINDADLGAANVVTAAVAVLSLVAMMATVIVANLQGIL